MEKSETIIRVLIKFSLNKSKNLGISSRMSFPEMIKYCKLINSRKNRLYHIIEINMVCKCDQIFGLVKIYLITAFIYF